MSASQEYRCRLLKIVSVQQDTLHLPNAIKLIVLAISGSIALSGRGVLAQITLDATLGGQSSVVTPNVNVGGFPADRIDGGVVGGTNLFHSFLEFNVGNGQRVYFTNPPGIENILSRVTGANPSNMLGTLGVTGGNANLFLINPHGIIFGANARLDMGGSFVATTANAIAFETQGFFSTSDTGNNPSLLTVNPSALLFNQLATQGTNAIEVQPGAILSVGDKSLLLVGGNASPTPTATGQILIDGGTLQAPGGRIELGGVAGVGTVQLNVNGNNLNLSFPNDLARADVSITSTATSDALIDVTAGNGGSITINARNIDILGTSLEGRTILQAGIASGQGFPGAQAGDITLNATGAINASLFTFIVNNVLSEGIGNGGNILVKADSLSLLSSQFGTSTSGQGNAGSVLLDIENSAYISTIIFNNVFPGAVGNSGGITVKAGSLTLDDALLSANTRGNGDSGNIFLDVTGQIEMKGQLGGSRLFTNVNSAGSSRNVAPVGNGGEIRIKAGSLFLSEGSGLIAETEGIGNAGSIIIEVPQGAVSFDRSVALTRLLDTAQGEGGDIRIDAKSLSLTNGAQLTAETMGQGNAGKIQISTTDSVTVSGSSQRFSVGFREFEGPSRLSTRTASSGRGGDILITTNAFRLSDTATLDAQTLDSGTAGNIKIAAGSVALTNGAAISASTSGSGNAGDIELQVEGAVSLDGSSSISSTRKAAVSGFETDSLAGWSVSGSADVDRTVLGSNPTEGTYQAIVTNLNTYGAVPDSDLETFLGLVSGSLDNLGNGNATEGSAIKKTFTAQAGDVVEFDWNFLTNESTPDATFNDFAFVTLVSVSELADTGFPDGSGSGFIRINRQFKQTGVQRFSATIPTSGTYTLGIGVVDVRDTNDNFRSAVLVDRVALPESTGNGGNITIQAQSLTLTDNSRVEALTRGRGNSGTIQVTTSNSVDLSSGGLFTSTEATDSGLGGNIRVTTPTLRVADGAVLNARTQSVNPGGDISVDANTVAVTSGGQLLTTTLNQGQAGNITLNVTDNVAIAGSNSGLFARTQGAGAAGDVSINTPQLAVREGAQVSASTSGTGQGGSLNVTAPQSVTLSDNSQLSVETSGAGAAGDVTIATENLTVANGARVSATATAEATTLESGGSINVNASQVNLSGTGGLFAQTQGVSPAGTLTLQPNGNGQRLNVTLQDGAQISASTSGTGQGGSLNAIAPESITISGNGKLSVETSGAGRAGNITVTTSTLTVEEGARVSATATADATPSETGGSINVNASHVNLSGAGGLFAETQGVAPAGTLTLQPNGNTQALTVNLQDGGKISASTTGSARGGSLRVRAPESITISGNGQLSVETSGLGQAGNLSLETGRLLIRDGAQVSASTSSSHPSGAGGNLTAIATQSVELSNGASLLAQSTGAGTAGNLTLNTGQLTITDNAQAAVSGQGTGNGGTLTVSARSVLLNNQGRLIARTASGEGGNIQLQLEDLVLMRHNSLISAEAGGTGNGGNIDIDAPFIVAVPIENSDIVANAFQGRGGNINITTQGIFGIEYRERLTPLSDITASSELGIDGVVEITTLGIDPSQGLTQLPIDIVDATGLIDRRCAPSGETAQNSSFTVTGRGGLPPNPNETLGEEGLLEDLGTSVAVRDRNQGERSAVPVTSANTPPTPLVEAQGWVIAPNGTVILTAQGPSATPQHPWQTPASCQSVSNSSMTNIP